MTRKKLRKDNHSAYVKKPMIGASGTKSKQPHELKREYFNWPKNKNGTFLSYTLKLKPIQFCRRATNPQMFLHEEPNMSLGSDTGNPSQTKLAFINKTFYT